METFFHEQETFDNEGRVNDDEEVIYDNSLLLEVTCVLYMEEVVYEERFFVQGMIFWVWIPRWISLGGHYHQFDPHPCAI